jgi:septal ring factor EnvC (AmiA/AmiB activator)
LLDESNSFDLKNQIYELTSKYNNLEYEKNKMLMSYENVLKEHKQKYAILERLCSEKQEKEDKLNYMLTELRSKCAYLAEENDALKKELHSLFEKNRITPDFNTIELAQEMNMLGDLLDKE